MSRTCRADRPFDLPGVMGFETTPVERSVADVLEVDFPIFGLEDVPRPSLVTHTARVVRGDGAEWRGRLAFGSTRLGYTFGACEWLEEALTAGRFGLHVADQGRCVPRYKRSRDSG